MPLPEVPVPPGRPRLAPGRRVVRRGLDQLQVGLYADRRALLPRTPEVQHVLARLLQQQPVDDVPTARAVLTVLDEQGCLDRGRPSPGGTVAVLGGAPPPGPRGPVD